MLQIVLCGSPLGLTGLIFISYFSQSAAWLQNRHKIKTDRFKKEYFIFKYFFLSAEIAMEHNRYVHVKYEGYVYPGQYSDFPFLFIKTADRRASVRYSVFDVAGAGWLAEG